VNGKDKLPNVLGKDLFAISIEKDKVYPFGYSANADWCHAGNRGYVGNVPRQAIDDRYYAGIGCSYEYLYGKKYK
jgi:hypothetical protein